MRILSLVLLVTLSYVSAASESKTCVQGGPVPAECPNNYKWNSVTCKFECEPHCVSNEGNFIFPDADGTPFRQLCNACNCKVGGTVGICTKIGCDSSLCWDDDGNSHQVGETITSGCKTGTCTKVNGKGVWSWYSPASSTTKPNCPYGPGIFNKDTCKWECPTTCQDGSAPAKCLVQPCAVVRCGFGTVCTDNYCPNYPNTDKGACTAKCVRPVQCFADPCKAPVGQPKCGKNQVCEADYRFGCNYQCKDLTCEFNGEIFQVGETRPSEDGCNTCACGEDGTWACTLKACSTDKPVCAQGGPVPAECPTNNKWNPVTCKFECVCPQNQNCGINAVWDYENCRCVVRPAPPATEKPVCAQGGPVPAECPTNNKWNPVTCKFECVCPQTHNCGINAVWDYENCGCVVKPAPPTTVKPTTCPQIENCGINGVWDSVNCGCVVNPAPPATEKPICIQGGKVPDECPNNNKWNAETCRFECEPHCVSNEGNFIFPGQTFRGQCNSCTCNADLSATCTRIGCDNSVCYDDTGKSYKQGATLARGCKTATCMNDATTGKATWKWVNPAAQQPPTCDLAPAVFDKATCKWTCSKKCADGSNPPACLVNPCATILCAANSVCVPNSCPNFPNTEQGPCTATCQPITNCLVSPCSVNSCGKGQTCVDDYVGGCNYRCKDKFRM